MKRVTYIKLAICGVMVMAAVIAPVTGRAPANIAAEPAVNQIDISGLTSQMHESAMNIPEMTDKGDASLTQSIWNSDAVASSKPAVLKINTEDDLAAAAISGDNQTGYDKVTQIAGAGYADFGSSRSAYTSTASRDSKHAVPSNTYGWFDYPSAGYGGSGSDGNHYLVLATAPAGTSQSFSSQTGLDGISGSNGSGANQPVNDSTGGSSNSGSGTNGSQPVPVPGAVLLAIAGIAIVQRLRAADVLK